MASAASAFASRALRLRSAPPCALLGKGLGISPREGTAARIGTRGVGRWTGHESICCASGGVGGSWGGQGDGLIAKAGAQRWASNPRWGVKHGRQLRCLSNGPGDSEPQYSKKYATNLYLVTTTTLANLTPQENAPLHPPPRTRKHLHPPQHSNLLAPHRRPSRRLPHHPRPTYPRSKPLHLCRRHGLGGWVDCEKMGITDRSGDGD